MVTGGRLHALALLVVALLALMAPSRADARAKAYRAGYYPGQTSQGRAITFVVAHGRVSELLSMVTDTCKPGKWYVTVYPHTARVTSRGDWYHRTSGRYATVYHGHITGATASGAIDDVSKNKAGRICHGHVAFRAQRGAPVHVARATVGPRGTDVLLTLAVPAANNGNEIVPRTSLAMLVYGSNTGCLRSYRAADAQSRSAQSSGFIGLISDAYVTADYGFALFKSHKNGAFTFDVSTNTLLRAPSGQSPFSTVCVMLYSGTPATLTPSHNVALATLHGPLVRGPGIPNTQP